MENNSIIYLVDDDSSVRASLSLLLNSAGYDVECFSSAIEYLNLYKEKDISGCLILDVKMPELDGFELQEALISLNSSIPIVFITGHGDIPMSV